MYAIRSYYDISNRIELSDQFFSGLVARIHEIDPGKVTPTFGVEADKADAALMGQSPQRMGKSRKSVDIVVNGEGFSEEDGVKTPEYPIRPQAFADFLKCLNSLA